MSEISEDDGLVASPEILFDEEEERILNADNELMEKVLQEKERNVVDGSDGEIDDMEDGEVRDDDEEEEEGNNNNAGRMEQATVADGGRHLEPGEVPYSINELSHDSCLPPVRQPPVTSRTPVQMALGGPTPPQLMHQRQMNKPQPQYSENAMQFNVPPPPHGRRINNQELEYLVQDINQNINMPPMYPNNNRGVCKFHLRGACSWGNECKYLHVNPEDRPPPPFVGAGPPPQPMYVRYPGGSRPPHANNAGAAFNRSRNPSMQPLCPELVSPTEKGLTSPESAWERGLKQAKAIKNRSLSKGSVDAEAISSDEETLDKFEAELNNEDNASSRSISPIHPLEPPPGVKYETVSWNSRDFFNQKRRREREEQERELAQREREFKKKHEKPELPPPPKERNFNHPPPKIFRGMSQGHPNRNPNERSEGRESSRPRDRHRDRDGGRSRETDERRGRSTGRSPRQRTTSSHRIDDRGDRRRSRSRKTSGMDMDEFGRIPRQRNPDLPITSELATTVKSPNALRRERAQLNTHSTNTDRLLVHSKRDKTRKRRGSSSDATFSSRSSTEGTSPKTKKVKDKLAEARKSRSPVVAAAKAGRSISRSSSASSRSSHSSKKSISSVSSVDSQKSAKSKSRQSHSPVAPTVSQETEKVADTEDILSTSGKSTPDVPPAPSPLPLTAQELTTDCAKSSHSKESNGNGVDLEDANRKPVQLSFWGATSTHGGSVSKSVEQSNGAAQLHLAEKRSSLVDDAADERIVRITKKPVDNVTTDTDLHAAENGQSGMESKSEEQIGAELKKQRRAELMKQLAQVEEKIKMKRVTTTTTAVPAKGDDS